MAEKSIAALVFPRIRFYHIFKVLVLLVCFILFVVQVHTFFELYLKNATVSGITYEKSLTKHYPSVTVCPEGLLKYPGFPISPQEFDQHSFKLVIYFISESMYIKLFSLFFRLLFQAWILFKNWRIFNYLCSKIINDLKSNYISFYIWSVRQPYKPFNQKCLMTILFRKMSFQNHLSRNFKLIPGT